MDRLCFHNLAGVEVATPDSERGPWCGAVAHGSVLFVGAAIVLGVAVAVAPVSRGVRVALFVLAAISVIAIPVYMGTLDYSVAI